MKQKTNFLLMFVALLTYWADLSNANAFYDPGAQRWVNRDSLGDESIIKQASKGRGLIYRDYLRYEGMGNIFEFNHNNPNGYVDKDGRQIAVGIGAGILIGGVAVGYTVCLAIPSCRAWYFDHANKLNPPFNPTCPAKPAEPECKLKGASATGYGNEDTHCEYECGGKSFITTVAGGFGDEGVCPKDPKKSDLEPYGPGH